MTTDTPETTESKLDDELEDMWRSSIKRLVMGCFGIALSTVSLCLFMTHPTSVSANEVLIGLFAAGVLLGFGLFYAITGAVWYFIACRLMAKADPPE